MSGYLDELAKLEETLVLVARINQMRFEENKALLSRIAELELRLDAYNGNMLDVLQAENERLREEVERLSRQTGDK